MKEILLAALILFSLAGCGEKAYPPRIKTLKKVDDIKVVNGTISGKEIKKVMQLRKSETYYFQAITEYNKKFTKGGGYADLKDD